MRSFHGLIAATTAAVGLLCIPRLGESWPRRSVPPTAPSLPPVSGWSPSKAALMESRQHWMHAWNAVGKQQSQREAWDPAAAAESSPSWDHTEVARRPEMHLAHQSAQRALALAKSEPETYRSVRWLARVECALEQHREELRLAQRLASIAPGDEGALTCLLQAAKCNGRKELEQQTLAALKRRDTFTTRSNRSPLPDRGIQAQDRLRQHRRGGDLLRWLWLVTRWPAVQGCRQRPQLRDRRS
jgi:hypothetical protein